MKRILTLIACLSVLCASFFAEALDSDDIEAMSKFEKTKLVEETIVVDDLKLDDKNATVTIVYTPAYREARIYYDTLMVTFEEGQALNAVLAAKEKLMLEKGFKQFRRTREDDTRSYKTDRGSRTKYTSYFKFDY